MNVGDQGVGVVRRLCAEVRADLKAMDRVAQDLRRFSPPVSAERAAALALSLDRTYTALESILERIARTLEGGVPTGADWHRELLRNALLEIETVRPPILSEGSFAAVDELRRFRHFLRHAYAVTLDPPQIEQLAGAWFAAEASVRADLMAFVDFLGDLAHRLDHPRP